MATPTEQLTKVEDQILETITNLQKPVVDAVKSLAEKAEGRLSDVPDLPGSERLPAFDELLISQLAFLEKLMANQREFAGALIDAVKPVTAKTAVQAKAAKAKATAKAA